MRDLVIRFFTDRVGVLSFVCYNLNMSHELERESVFLQYVKWHYGQAIREIFEVTGNFCRFVAHFFSFKLLTKTLFAPWKRLGESYGDGFDLKVFASTLVVNTLMRLVGLVTRSVVLIVGFVSFIFVLVFSFFILLIWFLAPVVLIGSLVLSATFFAI
jgi:hypothetical protein